MPCQSFQPAEILDRLDADTTVVGIDEAQFFDEEISRSPSSLPITWHTGHRCRAGYRFSRRAIWPNAMLMAKAEMVDKLHAICMVCGEAASRTQRLVNGKPASYHDPVVIVGAAELYEARCRKHHEVPDEIKPNPYANCIFTFGVCMMQDYHEFLDEILVDEETGISASPS